MRNREVARKFANREENSHNGRWNYKFYQYGDTHGVMAKLFSYAECIAVIFRPDWAWVSDRRWNNTTTRHQSLAAVALTAAGYSVIRSPEQPKNRLPTLKKLWREQCARERAEQERWITRETARNLRRQTREEAALMTPSDTNEEIMPIETEPQSDVDTGFRVK